MFIVRRWGARVLDAQLPSAQVDRAQIWIACDNLRRHDMTTTQHERA
jgi:hypothetical protein